MIEVIRNDMRDAPMILCEVCGKRIENAGMGMVAYEEVEIEYEGPVGFTFLHKGECDQSYKGGNYRKGGWVELTHFLANLCNNSGLKTPEDMKEAMKGRDVLNKFG